MKHCSCLSCLSVCHIPCLSCLSVCHIPCLSGLSVFPSHTLLELSVCLSVTYRVHSITLEHPKGLEITRHKCCPHWVDVHSYSINQLRSMSRLLLEINGDMTIFLSTSSWNNSPQTMYREQVTNKVKGTSNMSIHVLQIQSISRSWTFLEDF